MPICVGLLETLYEIDTLRPQGGGWFVLQSDPHHMSQIGLVWTSSQIGLVWTSSNEICFSVNYKTIFFGTTPLLSCCWMVRRSYAWLEHKIVCRHYHRWERCYRLVQVRRLPTNEESQSMNIGTRHLATSGPKSQCSMLVLIFLKNLHPFGFISDCFSAKKERFPLRR